MCDDRLSFMEENVPFFSVVIPTFNSSLDICKTLDSVARQTFKDFEVVIVDDNSSDFYLLSKELERYSKLFKLKIFHSSIKINGAGARNLGVKESCGQYIAFLDSDDEWRSDKLKIMHERITEENSGQDKCIFYSKVNLILDGVEKGFMPLKEFNQEKETIAEYIFGCNGFIQTSSIVVKKSDMLSLMFNADFVRHQDYDLNIRASCAGFHFKYIDQPLSRYYASRKSHKLKGEGVRFSRFWLSEMSPFLNRREISTYKAFRLSQRYLDDSRKIMFFYVFILNFTLCSSYQKKEFIKKMISKLLKRR